MRPAGFDFGDEGYADSGMGKSMDMGVAVMPKERFEIRRDGETVCTSPLPMCGYTPKRLREILAAGYRYYIDGKLQRKVD